MLCHVQGLSRVCQWQLRGRLRTAIACCLCCGAHPYIPSCYLSLRTSGVSILNSLQPFSPVDALQPPDAR